VKIPKHVFRKTCAEVCLSHLQKHLIIIIIIIIPYVFIPNGGVTLAMCCCFEESAVANEYTAQG